MLLWYCTNIQYIENAFQSYSRTPLIRSPIGQKNLAVLMGVYINKVSFFTRKYMAILPGGKKSGHNDEVTVRQSFTVRSALYEYQCT